MRLFQPWLVPSLVWLLGVCGALAAPPQRIAGEITGKGLYTLPGNIHRIPAAAHDAGPADPSSVLPRITLHLSMTPRQQSDLNALLAAQQAPGNSQYHKWLTPEQFAERFGANEGDIRKIVFWLENQGFSDVEVARGHNAISFSGTAQQVKMTFDTGVHSFYLNGAAHYANLTDPVLPAALKGIVEGIRGLNSFHPKPHLVQRWRGSRPRFTSSLTGSTFLAPGDFATIYDVNPIYNSGIDGSGVTIAVAGQSDIQLSDIEAFRAAAGLAPNDPAVVLDGTTDPGTKAGDESESDLDLEWVGAIAKNAKVVFVNSADAFTSVQYAIQNNLADVLLITYGACESSVGSATANAINAEFQQASAQGMTIVAASGDDGAADCDEGPVDGTPPGSASEGYAVDFPASSPYVTAAGGTEFNENEGSYWQPQASSDIVSSALSYIPEVAWNDSNANGYLSASGGGASALFSKPAWQVGSGVPADGARDVPDISFSASADHDGYLICSADQDDPAQGIGGKCTNGFRDSDTYLDSTGGTSTSVPAMAGIVALLDQKLGGRQGNINAKLYSIASVSTDAFHDITQGSNTVTCQQTTPNCPTTAPFQFGYSAGPGYDQVTGLGSIDAYNLLREWNRDFSVAVNPSTLTLGAGTTASASVTITPSDGFDTAVSFTCGVSAELANTTCSIPGTVPGSGTATLTIASLSSAGSARWPGFLSGSWRLPTFICLAGCALSLLLRLRKRARLAAIALAGCSFLVVSCGGGDPSSASMSVEPVPVPESGTVTITATAGALSHTASLSVTVE